MLIYQHRNCSKFSLIWFSADYSSKILEGRTLLAEILCDPLHWDGGALARQRTTDRFCTYLSQSFIHCRISCQSKVITQTAMLKYVNTVEVFNRIILQGPLLPLFDIMAISLLCGIKITRSLQSNRLNKSICLWHFLHETIFSKFSLKH